MSTSWKNSRHQSRTRLQCAPQIPVYLHYFAQREPVPLVRCFDANIESISTGSRNIAPFAVAKGITKSQPLLSLDTCIELGLLYLTNATNEKKTERASQTSASSTDPVVMKLTSEYHKVFSGLGKLKSMKAKLQPWSKH